MNNNRLLLVAVIAATTLCAALVWSNVVSVGRARELRAQLAAKQTELQKLSARKQSATTRLVDTGMGDLLAERDAEYAKLREENEKLRQQLTNGAPAAAAAPEQRPGRGGRGNNANAFLERLRLQDPERYQQIITARQQRQQRVEEQYKEQMAQLDNRIQTAPTQEEVDLASQIADTIDRLGQLRQKMQALRDLPEDQRQAAFQELGPQLREATQTLRDLRDQDRTMQLQQLGTQLGLQGQSVQALVEGVPQIYQKTQYQVPGGGGPGGPGGGFGGRGGFGGGGDGQPGGGTGSGGTQSQTPQSPSTSTSR